jgi:hypothetical protein
MLSLNMILSHIIALLLVIPQILASSTSVISSTPSVTANPSSSATPIQTVSLYSLFAAKGKKYFGVHAEYADLSSAKVLDIVSNQCA